MTEPTVTRFPGVYRRGDSVIYQFGLRVPLDLRHAFAGPWAVRCSLNTSDLSAANSAAKERHAYWALEFARLRGGASKAMSPNFFPASEAVALGPIRKSLFDKLRHNFDRIDAECSSFSFEQREERARDAAWQRDDLLQGLREGYVPDWAAEALTKSAHPRTSAVDAEVLAHLVNVYDLRAEALSDATRDFPKRRAWLANRKGLLESGSDGLSAMQQELVELDTAAPKSAGPRLAEVLNRWEQQKTRPVKTLIAFRRHCEMFVRAMGDPPLALIDRQCAVKFRDWLATWAITQSKTAVTANNILASIKALANVADEIGWLQGDPFRLLTVAVGGRVTEDREPWTREELHTLFDDPIWAMKRLPDAKKAGADAAYWIPLIACYTGARISEIAGLYADDLTLDSGREVIEIRANEARKQHLKNDWSWRAIPMHPELVRLGLVRYAESVGSGPLFPRLKTNGINGPGGMFGAWFGKYKESKGFPGQTKTMHSFRHLVASELRMGNNNESLVNAILGHSGQSVGQRVYAATIRRKAESLRPIVSQLEFGLGVLPVLY